MNDSYALAREQQTACLSIDLLQKLIRAQRQPGSVEQYAEVRQTLGEPDPFRLRYIDQVVALIGEAVREGATLRDAVSRSRRWSSEHAAEPDRERFREMVEMELLGLNEGNFARFGLRPSEFLRWRTGAGAGPDSPTVLVDSDEPR